MGERRKRSLRNVARTALVESFLPEMPGLQVAQLAVCGASAEALVEPIDTTR